MTQIRMARFAWGAAVALVLLNSAPAIAQSDGTVEEAYVAQCPQHQNTQICNTLRKAMERAAGAIPPGSPSSETDLRSLTSSLPGAASRATSASTQTPGTLEQDYASLCANKPAPETETCATLKRALVAKLSGNTIAAQPKAAIKQAANTLTQAEIRTRWGMYADIVGKKYYSKGAATSFITTLSWQVPGEVLVILIEEATKRGEIVGNRTRTITTLRWDAAGDGIVSDGYEGVLRPQSDGSFFTESSDGKHRTRGWLSAGGSWTQVVEKKKGNVWKPIDYGTYQYSEMTPQFMAQLRGSSSGGGGLLKVVQGAIAGAAGMANGGGGMDAAIAGAAAGAFAGAAGVEAGSIQGGFQQGASEVNASNAEMQRSFERSMADAGAPGYGSNSPTASKAMGSTGDSASPTAAGGTRTVRMVLIAGILPTEADFNPPNGLGRNPDCRSNIITATIRKDDRGSNVPVEELFERYRASFVAKCARLGTISTNPTYEIEEPYSIGFGEYGWNDRRVTLP